MKREIKIDWYEEWNRIWSDALDHVSKCCQFAAIQTASAARKLKGASENCNMIVDNLDCSKWTLEGEK